MTTGREPGPSGPRRALRGFAVSLGALVFLLAGAEVAVRLLADVPPVYAVLDPQLGKRYVPNWKGEVLNDESGRLVKLRFNRHGFRFPDLPMEKPAGTRRVVFLGDSMIAAEQVQEDETSPVLLEQRLDAMGDEQDWQVLNFGVSGAGTGQEYVLYRELARDYRPDVVLCAFFVGNDFADNSTHFARMRHGLNVQRLTFDLDDRGELVQDPYPSLGLRFRAALNRHSRFYVWEKRATSELKRLFRGEPEPPTGEPIASPVAHRIECGDAVRASEWIYCTEEDEAMRGCWSIERAEIEALARAAAEDGAYFALVILPAAEQVHDDVFEQICSIAGARGDAFDAWHPSRRLGAICAELDVPCFDLLPDFRAAAPSHSGLAKDEWLFLSGYGHLNPRGHAVVAEGLARRLAASPELPGR